MAEIYSYATKSWAVVKGCDNSLPCAARCWAKRTVNRLAHAPNQKVREAHAGLVQPGWDSPTDPHYNELAWTGTVRLNESHLTDPLHWRDPQRVAVAYHGDIGLASHESLARIFKVMAWCSQHQYLILTKRIEGLKRYIDGMERLTPQRRAQALAADADGIVVPIENCGELQWPLPNVWLGVSAEDQAAADARIPLLLQTPAAVRWVSLEPLTGPVDLKAIPRALDENEPTRKQIDGEFGCHYIRHGAPGLDWVVVGGPGDDRPCDVRWIRDVVRQCAEAGVPCWVKQMGSYAILDPRYDRSISGWTRKLHDRKGADPTEWPADLRVRQMPEVKP